MIKTQISKSSKSITTLNIAVPCPLYQTFNYLPTPNLKLADLKPGMRIKIPFGPRKLIGIFLKIEYSTQIDIKKLKPIITVLDNIPVFSSKILKLLTWLADYYHYPIGEVLALAMPTILRQGEQISSLYGTAWTLSKADQNIDLNSFAKSPKQAEIIKFLKTENLLTENKLTALNFSRASLRTLCKKNIIKVIEIEPGPNKNLAVELPLILNLEQEKALQTIQTKLHTFNIFLLQGITGSGKTEVYFHVIEKVLKQKKQVLVLVPEIGLTPQMLTRFQKRFTATIGTIHSSLTDKQRFVQWFFAKQNKLDIIIGTRSAIFSPLENLGLIIVDEEHDQSFKQQDSLRYSARDTAIVYAKQLNVPIILGSATPSLESFYNCQQKKYQLLTLTQRAANASLPKVQLLDVRNQVMQDGFSSIALKTIKSHLANNNQVLIFLNRRGFSPKLICHSCGYLFQCKHCDAYFVYHQKDNKIICHHCDKQQILPKNCLNCQSEYLLPLGLGTERIESFLEKFFVDYQLIRIDRDTTRKKGSLTSMLDKINDEKFQILIGTQMLAKGHHFPNVTLSVIVDVDASLFSEDLRAAERMGQLIIQVAGRSGRGDKLGEVLIQTRQPENELLQLLLRHDYFAFLQFLLMQRKSAFLPPFTFLALFRAESLSSDNAFSFLHDIKKIIASKNTQVSVFGPTTAPIQKKADRFRLQLLLQAQNRTNLQALLTELIKKIYTLNSSKKVKWSLDVDPVDLF